MKLVINKCYGGFSISREAGQFMADRGHDLAQLELMRTKNNRWSGYGFEDGYGGYERHDPLLIEAVETLGEKSWGDCAELVIIEIPDDVEYMIEEYDGMEWVSEKHRTWS